MGDKYVESPPAIQSGSDPSSPFPSLNHPPSPPGLFLPNHFLHFLHLLLFLLLPHFLRSASLQLELFKFPSVEEGGGEGGKTFYQLETGPGWMRG